MKTHDLPGPTRRAVLIGGCAMALTMTGRAGAQGEGAEIVLRAEVADIPLLPGEVALRAAAFDAGAPGPVLMPARGAVKRMAVENAAGFAFGMHFIGVRGRSASLEAAQPIAPGERRLFDLATPDAGTFLYRASTHEADGAAALLSGPIVVEGDGPLLADRAVVLALNSFLLPDDRAPAPPDPEDPPPDPDDIDPFADEDPEIAWRRISTVNGVPALRLAARPGERLRLRLINLADAQLAALRLEGAPRVVAIDGQPCPPFPPLGNRVVVPPGGRMDILVTIPVMGAREVSIRDEFSPGDPLVRIAVEGAVMGSRFLADTLPDNPALPKAIPLEKAKRGTVTLGEPGPGDKPLVAARSGESVVLAFANRKAVLFAVHVAGHAARLLDGLDDGWKPWWHDTILVHPGETARLAFIAGAPGDYRVSAIPIGGGEDIVPTVAMLRVL